MARLIFQLNTPAATITGEKNPTNVPPRKPKTEPAIIALGSFECFIISTTKMIYKDADYRD
jgi:hypothetical protein